jgi:hypothetical protein
VLVRLALVPLVWRSLANTPNSRAVAQCSRPIANLLGAPPDGSIPKPTLAKSFDFINSE